MSDLLMAAILFLLPGYAAWFAFGTAVRARITAVEALFLIILGGLVMAAWTGMVLAEFGLFSLSLLLALVVVGSLMLIGWGLKNGSSPNPFRGTTFQLNSLLVLPILALAIWLAPHPFEHINGGRDHGLYVNSGVHIAQTGGILIHDTDLTAVPPTSRALLTLPETSVKPAPVPGPWSQGQRLPGLTIRSLADGIVAPHAFQLYPVLIAIFHSIGGLQWALATTTILALLGAWGVYIVGARLFGPPIGLLAYFLLTISLAQFWYSQTPSAEILLQPLFWGGLLAFLLMLTTRNGYTAVLAGLSLGLMHLTKLDTVFIPIILAIFLAWVWFRGRFYRVYWLFTAVYGLIALHAALHAFFIATIYFLDQMTRVLLPDFLAQIMVDAANGFTQPGQILGRLVTQNGGLIAGVLIGTVLLLWTARRFRGVIGRQLARIERNGRWGQGLLSWGLGLSVLGIFFAQTFQPMSQLAQPWQFLTFSSWYLTPLGLLLGVVGMVQVIAGADRNRPRVDDTLPRSFAALMLVGNILPLFFLGSGTYPDQFWAIRRFVPIVLPAFILFAAYVLWHLVPQQRQNWPQFLLPLGLTAAVVMGQGQNIRPFLGFTNYKEMTNQVTQLAESFPEDAVLLFERGDAASRVTAPLWFIFDRTVFLVDNAALTDPALLPAITQWQADGRSVFWLGLSGSTPPTTDGFALNYESVRTLAVPLAEGPVGRLPQRNGLFLATFDVHEVLVDTAVTQSVTTIAVGGGEDGAVPAEGLYTPNKLPTLTARRWTSGQVKMELPVSGELVQLSLMMGNGRPGDIPKAKVSVYLNDTLLDTVKVKNSNDIFDFAIPPDVAIIGETAVLRLEMEPWTPADTGHSSDSRQLGVYLDWIKLITIER